MILKGGLGLTSGHKKSLNIILTVLTEIMDRVTKNGKALGVESDFIQAFFNAIHDESIRQQTLIHSKEK